MNFLARPRRFERPTPFLGGRYSIQLSYGRIEHRLLDDVFVFDVGFKEVKDIVINFFFTIII